MAVNFQKDSPESLFREIDHYHRRALDTQMATNGLQDIGQPLILVLLERHGVDGMIESQKELADMLRVTPATVAVSLKSMERSGYVRKLTDENDMRRKPIAITEKGRKALKILDAVFESIDRGMYYGFSLEEREQIAQFYNRIIQNLRHMYKNPQNCMEGNEVE